MDTTQERDEKHSKTYDEQKAYLDFYNKLLEIKDEQIIPLKEAVGKLRGTVYIISLIGIVFFFILGILVNKSSASSTVISNTSAIDFPL